MNGSADKENDEHSHSLPIPLPVDEKIPDGPSPPVDRGIPDGPPPPVDEKTPNGRPPPVDERILDGPPPTTWHDFKHARLRQFPGHGTRIKWLGFLGYGEEGSVYKVSFGNGDPVVLKVFWRSLRPDPIPISRGRLWHVEWPFADESRTVALMEKIQWVMRTDPEVKIRKGPQTFDEAIRNFYLFSDEGRQKYRHRGLPYESPPPFSPLPACYGWMKIQVDQLPVLDYPAWYNVDGVDWHWALVYEFVPGATQDRDVGQLHLDFFHAVGFCLEPYKPDNWRGGD